MSIRPDDAMILKILAALARGHGITTRDKVGADPGCPRGGHRRRLARFGRGSAIRQVD